MSPPARVRYRHFERNLDMAEVRQIAADAHAEARRDMEAAPLGIGPRGDNADEAAVAAGVAALVSAPRQVETYEGETTVEDLRRMLKQGQLSPDDLVEAGHGWQLIRECPLFLDDVVQADSAKASRKWLWVGLTLVALGGLAAALAA
jgi:hypothetical protein